MSKSIKILFLFLIISLFYKSMVIACGPYFPDSIYDPSQILSEYYPLVSNIGGTDFKIDPVLNNKFEIITPLLGPEYLFPIYLASKNKQLPDNLKEAYVNYLYDKDYLQNIKEEPMFEYKDSVDYPVLAIEKSRPTSGQKFLSFIDDIFNKNKSPEEMEKEYKFAADEYHKGDYDNAITLFSKIYKNKKHSNRDKAALSLGWSYIAKANRQYEIDLKNEYKGAEDSLISNLKIAQTYYEKIVNDSSLSEVKPEAEKYLDYVLYRTDPVTRLTRAGNAMMKTSDPKEFLMNLDDYIPLWYKYFYNHIVYDKEVPEFEKYSKQIKESGDEFSQFLLAWTDIKSNILDQNINKYKETKSPLWLILAQRKINNSDQQWSYVDSEIKKIKSDSPFYLTAQYYNLDSQKPDSELKESIKSLITQTGKDKQYSAQNLFNGLMFDLTDNLIEKQKYSLMNYLGSSDYYWDTVDYPPYYFNNFSGTGGERKLLSYKMQELLNSLEINKFNDLLSDENIFNPQIKQYLRLVLFTNATLSNRLDISKNIGTLLAKNNSEIAKDLSAFNKSQNDDEKKFLAAKFILTYPGIATISTKVFDDFVNDKVGSLKEIDDFRRNWSFGEVCYKFESDKTDEELTKSEDFLVNKIGQIVVDFAVKNPDNQFVPESLHQVVNMVHYASCGDKKSGDYAKRAFNFLHTNYPNNSWTKETPYWYEN